ncbi:MAG: hypothetical protein JWP78_1931 [Mucilaginibacter sp.]|nr:hypothetical protein [Mucilaginibacter sp.]
MNNTFHLTRFGRLFIKHTVEHYKSYLMSLTVLIGVMVLGGSFMVYMINVPIDKGFQTAIFMMILCLGGTIFTSTVFTDIGDKKKAVSSLTLPASHFEKFLVGWIYSFLIFIVVYTATFYLIVLFAVNLKHFSGQPAEIINVFDNPICWAYLLYAFLHAIAFHGAIFFEKLHFLKTSFAFFIYLAILTLINKVLLDALLGRDVNTGLPFGNIRFVENNKVWDLNITDAWDSFILIFLAVLALIFWVAAYYRLKEKQV